MECSTKARYTSIYDPACPSWNHALQPDSHALRAVHHIPMPCLRALVKFPYLFGDMHQRRLIISIYHRYSDETHSIVRLSRNIRQRPGVVSCVVLLACRSTKYLVWCAGSGRSGVWAPSPHPTSSFRQGPLTVVGSASRLSA